MASANLQNDRNDLPDSLLASLRSGLAHTSPPHGRLILHRSLLFLQAIIKSLSSNRMMKGRTLMANLCSTLFPTLRELHERVLSMAVEKMGRDGLYVREETEDMELALLSFKCLSKLVIYGFPDASANEEGKVGEIFPPPELLFVLSSACDLCSFSSSPPSPHCLLSSLSGCGYSQIRLLRLYLHPSTSSRNISFLSESCIELYWRTTSHVLCGWE